MKPTRRRLAAASVTVLVALGACGDERAPSEPERATLTIATDAGEVAVNVEIADTTEEKTTGLMFRDSLPDDAGMVFLEEEPVTFSFTMRNVTIPLSLAVWSRDGRIRSIIDMEPCEEEPCPSYDTGTAWVGALEVNQGFFEEHSVAVGDAVRLER